MPDIVFYTNNVPALVDEAEAKGYLDWLIQDPDGSYRLGGDRTPLIEKHPEVIALLRVNDLEAANGFTSMQALGHYENGVFVPASPEAETIYNRVYDRTPIVKDTLAGEITITPPEEIGRFA